MEDIKKLASMVENYNVWDKKKKNALDRSKDRRATAEEKINKPDDTVTRTLQNEPQR